MIQRPYIFLDIDSVLVVDTQYFTGKLHPKYNCYAFDKKCVKVLNEILEKTSSIIIVSSDWKHHYNIDTLNEIFKDNGVNDIIVDVTGSSWGVMFTSLQQLDECRAYEINKYVKEHEITNWVAIDDLDLKPWIPDNFVRCTRSTEGLKQSGIKDKILKILI